MNAPSAALPAPRVTPNARHAFGGIFRLTLRRFLTTGHLLAVAGSLALVGLLAFGNGRRDTYLDWIVGFYVTLLVPIVAFITAAGALRDDMKSTSVDYLLTRPVRRPAFILFKYFSHVACSQCDFLLALVVVLVVGHQRGVPGVLAAAPLLLFAQVLVIVAFSALGFFAAALTTRYTLLGLGYGAIVEVGIGQIPTQLNKLSMTAQVKAMLGSLNPGADPTAIALAAGADPSVVGTTSVLLALAAVMVALAAAVFSLRELSSATD